MNVVQIMQELIELEDELTGTIIRPDDPNYDASRAVWNGMIDHHPATIVRCHTTEDVLAAVSFARDNGLEVSVRGGGHNVAGTAVKTGALVIDLSEMKRVTVAEESQIVRVQGGATLADLDAETQKYGLAVPAGVASETGVAGLTLGGGFGWLRNKYGLTCDNLIGATVVTSGGRIVNASEDQNVDLLWALRGGGGQFGVVTEFVFQAHEVGPNMMFVFVMHPADDAKGALEFYRDYVASAPDEVSSIAAIGHVPPEEHFPEEYHGKMFILFGAAYAGGIDEGERVLQPLRDYTTPIVDFSDVMPYTEMQQMWDEDYPSGELRYYWKSAYLKELTDEAIDTLVEQAAIAPSVLSTVDIWHIGNAIRKFDETTSAFGKRDADVLIGIEANWEDADDDDGNIAWGRGVANALQPFSTQRRYLNFPGFLEDDDLMKAMFGNSTTRITAIKAKYDPFEMFSLT